MIEPKLGSFGSSINSRSPGSSKTIVMVWLEDVAVNVSWPSDSVGSSTSSAAYQEYRLHPWLT